MINSFINSENARLGYSSAVAVPESVCSQHPKDYIKSDKKYLNDESLDESINDLLIGGEDQDMTKDDQKVETEVTQELLPLDKASLKLYADAVNTTSNEGSSLGKSKCIVAIFLMSIIII